MAQKSSNLSPSYPLGLILLLCLSFCPETVNAQSSNVDSFDSFYSLQAKWLGFDPILITTVP
ncbi:MAG: hypothetical protein ACKO2V_14165, partial [Snowella sp.]